MLERSRGERIRVRFALSDQTFPLLDHEEALDMARILRIPAIDLVVAGNRSQVRPEEIRQDIGAWAERVGERLRSRGLEVADVFLIPWTDFETLAPNHPDAQQREDAAALFRDVLEFARLLGAPGLTLLPGIDFPDESHAVSMARAAEELAWRAREAREAGVRLSVEPHLGSLASTPGEASTLVEATPGLELTVDYGHFVYQGFSEADIEPLLPHARHLHVRGAARGRLQASMKDNTIDFERVVDSLRDLGYDGYLGLEYVWIDWERCNECDNVAETILLRERLAARLESRA
jgi:sugar phosphate isomerase/epimerase